MSLDQFLLSSNTTDLNYPEIRPTLDLNFARVKALDPRITFTRASGGSYVGADGLIKYAGVNEPRFDHDPVTGESLGFLVEESRTNSTLHSQNLSNASWSKSNCNSTSNDAIAPDGTLTATKITTEANDNGGVVVNQDYSYNQNPVSFTYSIFAKAGTYRYIGIQGFVGVWSTTVVFDLQTGTIFTPSNFIGSKIAQIVSYGNGWYRCSVTYPAYFYYYYRFQFALTSYVGSSDYGIYDNNVSPTAGQFIYVWGAQLEAGAFPTSYIPTEGSSRTRAADAASISGKNFSEWYNQSEGTLLWKGIFDSYNSSGSNDALFAITDGSTNNRFSIRPRNTLATSSGNTLFESFDWGYTVQSNTYMNGALAIKSGDYALVTSGVVRNTSSSSSVPQVNRIENFNSIEGGYTVTGIIHHQRITYYPKRLTDAQLQVLTR